MMIRTDDADESVIEVLVKTSLAEKTVSCGNLFDEGFRGQEISREQWLSNGDTFHSK